MSDGWASLILPAPNDRHVLAAAIRAGADEIVTANLADFPAETLKQYDIEAQHPDEFIHHLLDLAPAVGCGLVSQRTTSSRKLTWPSPPP